MFYLGMKEAEKAYEDTCDLLHRLASALDYEINRKAPADCSMGELLRKKLNEDLVKRARAVKATK